MNKPDNLNLNEILTPREQGIVSKSLARLTGFIGQRMKSRKAQIVLAGLYGCLNLYGVGWMVQTGVEVMKDYIKAKEKHSGGTK